jgi:Tfp pilus assembly protein PilF
MGIDQVPMYGDIDRQSVPELGAADKKLIEDATKEFGSRDKASAAFIRQGFILYSQNDNAKAMKRFNQAWLLNPDNPEVYWGFGSVLHDQGKNCEALKLMQKALSYKVYLSGLYPDTTRIYALCASSDNALSSETKKTYYDRELYETAEAKDTDKVYVYSSWASALYWQGNYREAWEKVTKQRELGGAPNEKFLSLLKAKMPEPLN